MKWLLEACIALVLALLYGGSASALMTSTNYRLYGDEIGTAGNRSTSASYILEDTAGSVASGDASSTNYNLLAGFQALSEFPVFTFSVSSASVGLGTLSTSAVSTATQTATTSTNAPYGYTTTLVEDGNLRTASNSITDVSDGAVTTGSEEYGVSVSGTDAAFGDDRALSTSPLTLASRSTWKNASAIVVTYKAAISSLSQGGGYSQTLTYVSTGNF